MKSKRYPKTGEYRDKQLNLRFSQTEIDKIDALCDRRQRTHYRCVSRSDIIMLAVKFAEGQIPDVP